MLAVVGHATPVFAQAEEAPEGYQPPAGIPISTEPSRAKSQEEAAEHRWVLSIDPRFVVGLNGQEPRIGYGAGVSIGRALVVRGVLRFGLGGSFAYERLQHERAAALGLSGGLQATSHASFSADLRVDALLRAGRIRPWGSLGPALSIAQYSEPASIDLPNGVAATRVLPALRAGLGLAVLVWHSIEVGARFEWLVTFDGKTLGSPPVQAYTPGTFSIGVDLGFRF
jgi:hypothetical protein